MSLDKPTEPTTTELLARIEELESIVKTLARVQSNRTPRPLLSFEEPELQEKIDEYWRK